jgi:hypothetical protein
VDRRRTRVHGGAKRRVGRGGSPVGRARESRTGRGRGTAHRGGTGGATRPEIATAAASRRQRCKRLGGEENERGVWGMTGRGGGPFIVAGGGHAKARKGEMAGGGGGIKGARLNAVNHD